MRVKQATKGCEGKTLTSAKHHHQAGSQEHKGRRRPGKKQTDLGMALSATRRNASKEATQFQAFPFPKEKARQTRGCTNLAPSPPIFPSARTKDGALRFLPGSTQARAPPPASRWSSLHPAPLALGRGLPGGGASDPETLS